MEKARKELENAGFRWDENGMLYYPENYVPLEYLD